MAIQTGDTGKISPTETNRLHRAKQKQNQLRAKERSLKIKRVVKPWRKHLGQFCKEKHVSIPLKTTRKTTENPPQSLQSFIH